MVTKCLKNCARVVTYLPVFSSYLKLALLLSRLLNSSSRAICTSSECFRFSLTKAVVITVITYRYGTYFRIVVKNYHENIFKKSTGIVFTHTVGTYLLMFTNGGGGVFLIAPVKTLVAPDKIIR